MKQSNRDANPAQVDAPKPGAAERRPYQRPAFIGGLAFERQALSCGANLMAAGPLIDGCGLRS